MFNDSRLFRLIVDEAEKTLAYVDLVCAREYAGLVADYRVRDAIFPMIEEEYRFTVEAILRLSGEREIADRFPQFRRRLARRLPTLAQVNRQQIALLRRFRDGAERPAPDDHLSSLLLSINCIARDLGQRGNARRDDARR